jgi:hypothetical protein
VRALGHLWIATFARLAALGFIKCGSCAHIVAGAFSWMVLGQKSLAGCVAGPEGGDPTWRVG